MLYICKVNNKLNLNQAIRASHSAFMKLSLIIEGATDKCKCYDNNSTFVLMKKCILQTL